MSTTRGVRRAVLLGAALVLSSPAVAAADSGFVAPIEEIPLTRPLVTGGRSLGMGGVAVAVSDDATALLRNPAAMARLQRIEVSGGFRRRGTDLDGAMAGRGFETSVSSTDLSSLRLAYPFPTFRGSLVFGLGAERVYDFADDRLADYESLISWDEPGVGPAQEGIWKQTEDYLSDGGITAYSLGAAVEASPNISLGAAVSYLSGDYRYDFTYRLQDVGGISDAYDEVRITEETDTDVSGLRGTVGALFYVSEQLSAGVALDTPVTLTFDGTQRSRLSTEPASDIESDDAILFSDKVTLPFSFRAGVAYAPTDLVVVGADVSFTDWSEIDYEGLVAEIEGDGDEPLRRRPIYEESFDYGLGVEVTLPSWPVRLRGGYMSRPIPYTGLDVDQDRAYFTLGAGLLIDTVLAFDIAWMKGAYERSDGSYGYEENADDTAFLVEAAYRF